MIETALLVIAGGVLWCAGVLGWMASRQREMERVLEVQLKGMNSQYLLGYEALTHSLDRFEKRLKVIEEEVL